MARFDRKEEETELEEGEICRDQPSLDDRIQRLFGSFPESFKGVLSTETLGPVFGGYGTFLLVCKTSSQPKSPFRPIAADQKLIERDDDQREHLSTIDNKPEFSESHVSRSKIENPSASTTHAAVQEKTSPARKNHYRPSSTEDVKFKNKEDDSGQKSAGGKVTKKRKNSPNKTIDEEKIKLQRIKVGSVRRMSTCSVVAVEDPIQAMRRKMKQIKGIRYCIRQPRYSY